ncbi:hypothetical protein [Bifidobacterium olomucense]|uniref:Uncharacterized protein n=1 Tax=Bifidobacterium olomucense TaxID=2675324 RepID=A0A7Y0EXA0_9BIFI|nr:hypothetical protein [Bifidobacterium sp. DSM 109959]NMM98110.1 hypothetical protein [Bifidobacterium sp. DSM 109959]
MSVKPLPCPYCGEMPLISRWRFRRMRPKYCAYHPPRMLPPQCLGLDDYNEISNDVYSVSEAILDWNHWAVCARQREGFDPWTNF